jgi:hypothetical protein
VTSDPLRAATGRRLARRVVALRVGRRAGPDLGVALLGVGTGATCIAVRNRSGPGPVAPSGIDMGSSSGERLQGPYPAFLLPNPRVVGEHGAGTQ